MTSQQITPGHSHSREPITVRSLSLDSTLLYHGSNVATVERFKKGENNTIGEGLYLTSEAGAITYAHYRAQERGGVPVVYEAVAPNHQLIDMRDPATCQVVLQAFAKHLMGYAVGKDLSWNTQGRFEEAIKRIEANVARPGQLKYALEYCCGEFSEFVKSRGYDGLIDVEGGEDPSFSNLVSYVIIDPSKIEIISQRALTDDTSSATPADPNKPESIL